MHSHIQVGALNMRSRNAAPVRFADFDMWDCSDYLPRAVPIVRVQLPVDFPKLTEVHVLPEVLPHRAHISVVLVASYLIPTIRASAEIGDKFVSVDAVARANVMGDEQLGFAVERKPQHRAAPLVGVAFVKVRLAGVNKAPHLVHLHVPGADVLDSGIKHLAGLLGRRFHQRQNRVLVQARESRDCADAHALKHHRKGFRSGFRVGVVRPDLRSRFGECEFAGNAAIPLDSALSVGSKSADYVVTTLAGHIGLDFLARQADDLLEVGIAAYPACRLALSSVSADGGALIRDGRGPIRTGISQFCRPLLYQLSYAPIQGGIHRLAPTDALRLFSHWWVSHSISPFAWIELLKSLRDHGKHSLCNLLCSGHTLICHPVFLPTMFAGDDDVSLVGDLGDYAINAIRRLARYPQTVYDLESGNCVVVAKSLLPAKQQHDSILKGIGSCDQRHDAPFHFHDFVQRQQTIIHLALKLVVLAQRRGSRFHWFLRSRCGGDKLLERSKLRLYNLGRTFCLKFVVANLDSKLVHFHSNLTTRSPFTW